MTNQERAKRLGSVLRARREELGYSARHVARAVGVRDSTIMRLERGAYAAPAPDKLARIAGTLELDLADVYAMAGYVVPRTFPAFANYLKLRYPSLSERAIDELHMHLDELLSPTPATNAPMGGAQ